MEEKMLLAPLAVSPQPIIELEYQQMLHQVLGVAARADLFTYLAEPRTLAEICAEKTWRESFTALFLQILELSGFVVVSNGAYEDSTMARAYLCSESYLCLWECLQLDFEPGGFARNIAALLENGKTMPQRVLLHWEPSRLRRLGAYAITGNLRETIAAIDLRGDERILDLGGGHALYSLALLEKYPQLAITVQDLPAVIPLAKKNAARFSALDRLHFIESDFIEEELAAGYDRILCFNILSGRERSAIILPKVYRALKPGGRVILKTRLEDCEDTLEGALDKLRWFSFGRGNVESSAYWLGLLSDMGFSKTSVLARLGSSGLLEGRKI